MPWYCSTRQNYWRWIQCRQWHWHSSSTIIICMTIISTVWHTGPTMVWRWQVNARNGRCISRCNTPLWTPIYTTRDLNMPSTRLTRCLHLQRNKAIMTVWWRPTSVCLFPISAHADGARQTMLWRVPINWCTIRKIYQCSSLYSCRYSTTISPSTNMGWWRSHSRRLTHWL